MTQDKPMVSQLCWYAAGTFCIRQAGLQDVTYI